MFSEFSTAYFRLQAKTDIDKISALYVYSRLSSFVYVMFIVFFVQHALDYSQRLNTDKHLTMDVFISIFDKCIQIDMFKDFYNVSMKQLCHKE